MKLTVLDVKKFKEAFKLMASVCGGKKHPVAVLGFIKLWYEDKRVFLSATDLETVLIKDITECILVEEAGEP